jgi:hypothetical protein
MSETEEKSVCKKSQYSVYPVVHIQNPVYSVVRVRHKKKTIVVVTDRSIGVPSGGFLSLQHDLYGEQDYLSQV